MSKPSDFESHVALHEPKDQSSPAKQSESGDNSHAEVLSLYKCSQQAINCRSGILDRECNIRLDLV